MPVAVVDGVLNGFRVVRNAVSNRSKITNTTQVLGVVVTSL